MVLEGDGISRNCGGFKFLLKYSKNEGIAHLESTARSKECAGGWRGAERLWGWAENGKKWAFGPPYKNK
jgi:hypothetical protein